MHQSICTSKAGLTSLRHVWAKYKDEVSDVSGSDQNIEASSNSKLKLTEGKDLPFKKTEILVKDECM